MDKKFVVLLIVLALIFLEVYFKIFSTIITGLVTIALSVASKFEITLEFLDMPNQVVQLTTTNVRVGLWNSGSRRVNETVVQLEVRDMSNNTASITEKTVLNLSTDERREVIVPWYASPSPGRYTMYVRGLYDNESSNEIVKNFTILSPPVVPEEPTIIPTPGGARIANISVSYPPRLNLTQDAEYIVIIKVENNGNLEIHNLTLELESDYIQAEVVYPGIVSLLEVDESVLFTTRLIVPANLELGEYKIYWFVSSEEVDKAGDIIGEVRVLDIREKAKELIAYYTSLLERLEDEIDAVKEEGKNVTLARNSLKEARTELDIAKELFKIGLYSESINQLELVREKIIESVRFLVLAEPIPGLFVIPALPVIPCLIWIIILIIVDSVIALYTMNRFHWIKVVLMMLVVSLVIGLLSGLRCLVWIAVTVFIMILVFIFIVLGERLRKEPKDLSRFRRW